MTYFDLKKNIYYCIDNAIFCSLPFTYNKNLFIGYNIKLRDISQDVFNDFGMYAGIDAKFELSKAFIEESFYRVFLNVLNTIDNFFERNELLTRVLLIEKTGQSIRRQSKLLADFIKKLNGGVLFLSNELFHFICDFLPLNIDIEEMDRYSFGVEAVSRLDNLIVVKNPFMEKELFIHIKNPSAIQFNVIFKKEDSRAIFKIPKNVDSSVYRTSFSEIAIDLF